MESIFASPSKYIQGKNVLKTGLHHIKTLGTKALLLSDDFVYELVGKELEEDLTHEGVAVHFVAFNGESSLEEINRITKLAHDESIDVVIGLGGGKTIDVAKAIADELSISVAILPTVASTDAPTSCISVIYTEDGLFDKYIYYKKHPDLVLVDTAVISKAPTRLLISGIADALSTWVEGRVISERGETNLLGGKPTLAAVAIAEKCQQVLFEQSLQAVAANDANIVTSSLEAVIEANTLLSGIGFESCGLAAAHAIHNGFSALKSDVNKLTHGEKVAYGTLAQLVLENRPKEELDKFINFYQTLGLPTTLEQMNLAEANYDELLLIGKQATKEGETIHKLSNTIAASDVADALIFVDSYVKKYHTN